MNIRPASASKNFTSTAALTVALLAAFGACSVDTDGIDFIPDDEFNAGSGASGGSSNTGGEGGENGTDEMCEPGERRCSDEGLLQTCEDGTPPAWNTDEDCEAPGRCSVLRNKCLECTPGEFRCNEAELQQCDMAGERFEAVQTCIDATACTAMGQTGYCNVCEPGETYCEGELLLIPDSGDDGSGAVNQVRTCAANGAYTELNVTCQGNEPLCNLEEKSCGSCVPGTFDCQGTDLYECGSDGRLQYVERCDSLAACKADVGECDNTDIECVIGTDQPRCTATGAIETCRADGTWQVDKNCGGAQFCNAGRCQPCPTNNSYTCTGDTVNYCWGPYNEPRLWPFQTCAAGGCTQGNSFCSGQCAPGTVQCYPNDNVYYVCDGAGNYGTAQNCGVGEFCNAYGSGCVSCLPNEYRCDGNTLKLCNGDGSSETTVENCSVSNTSCDAQLGKCGPYGGGGRYFCNEDGHFTYMSVDGQEFVEEDCSGRLCDPYNGCYGNGSGCTEGAVACEGRRVRVCDEGYYEENDVSCTSNTTCQPGVGCAIPVAVAAGYNHTCAILASPDNPDGIGYAVCWGDNSFGQLGNGTKPENGGFGDSVDARRVVLTFGGDGPDELEVNGFSIAAFSRLSAGRHFTCADIQDPESPGEYWVMCWGSNEFGQLGSDNPEPGPFNGPPQPFFVYPDTGGAPDDGDQLNLRHVTAGAEFACALDPGGAAWCWGKNDSGQLGIDSDEEFRPYASEVEGDHAFVEISAGARHVCAVESDGSVWCWGDNSFGQLGLGNGDSVMVPTQIEDVSVSGAGDAFPALGRDFSAVLAAEEDSPLSFGANLFGQLGDGTTMGRNEPAAMSSVSSSDARALFSSSTAQHQCLRDKDNQLYCVGANVFGQLGDKTTVDATEFVTIWDASSEARTLSGVRDAVAVGGRHTCAINSLNEIWCWGANHRHQLGSTKATPQTAPVKVF
jgi:alpha-tubulin suppressor-like RCC1 family protein